MARFLFRMAECEVEEGSEVALPEDEQREIRNTLGGCYSQEEDDDTVGFIAV